MKEACLESWCPVCPANGKVFQFVPHFDRYEWVELQKPNQPIAITNALLNERGKRYGDFMDQATIVQAFKSIMHGAAKWQSMQVDQKESLETIATKIGRILNGDADYEDSWRDIAGYAELVADRLLKEVVK